MNTTITFINLLFLSNLLDLHLSGFKTTYCQILSRQQNLHISFFEQMLHLVSKFAQERCKFLHVIKKQICVYPSIYPTKDIDKENVNQIKANVRVFI